MTSLGIFVYAIINNIYILTILYYYTTPDNNLKVVKVYSVRVARSNGVCVCYTFRSHRSLPSSSSFRRRDHTVSVFHFYAMGIHPSAMRSSSSTSSHGDRQMSVRSRRSQRMGDDGGGW